MVELDSDTLWTINHKRKNYEYDVAKIFTINYRTFSNKNREIVMSAVQQRMYIMNDYVPTEQLQLKNFGYTKTPVSDI